MSGASSAMSSRDRRGRGIGAEVDVTDRLLGQPGTEDPVLGITARSPSSRRASPFSPRRSPPVRSSSARFRKDQFDESGSRSDGRRRQKGTRAGTSDRGKPLGDTPSALRHGHSHLGYGLIGGGHPWLPRREGPIPTRPTEPMYLTQSTTISPASLGALISRGGGLLRRRQILGSLRRSQRIGLADRLNAPQVGHAPSTGTSEMLPGPAKRAIESLFGAAGARSPSGPPAGVRR